MDIVDSIDGDSLVHECALGLPGCGVLKPCPLHSQWSGLKEDILITMKNISLAELASKQKSKPSLFQPVKEQGMG